MNDVVQLHIAVVALTKAAQVQRVVLGGRGRRVRDGGWAAWWLVGDVNERGIRSASESSARSADVLAALLQTRRESQPSFSASE